MPGFAEDIEAIATHGRIHRAVLLVDADWRTARARRGPYAGQQSSFGDRRAARTFRRSWSEAPLTFTVAADGAHSPRLERLLRLAAYDELDVATCMTTVAGCPGVHSLMYYPTTPGDTTLKHSGLEDTEYGDHLDTPGAFAADIGGPLAHETALAWFAHRRLRRDVLVTTNEFMLKHREQRAWLEGCAVCTPEEATFLAELFLRRHDIVNTWSSARGNATVDRGTFYDAVARGAAPAGVQALRSCLAPARRAEHRKAADHLEGVIARLHDLALAQDRLAVRAQEEGFLGGGNDLLTDQMYDLQNSVVLFTGALDLLAWVVADVAGVSPDPLAVSWRSLRQRKGWVRNLDGNAMVLAAAAETAPNPALTELVIALRNRYQHRGMLKGAILSFEDEYRLVRAAYCAADVTAETKEACEVFEVQELHCPGMFQSRGVTFVLPHRFQKTVLRHCAAIVNHVLAAATWPDANWLEAGRSSRSTAPQAELEEVALRQFGF